MEPYLVKGVAEGAEGHEEENTGNGDRQQHRHMRNAGSSHKERS